MAAILVLGIGWMPSAGAPSRGTSALAVSEKGTPSRPLCAATSVEANGGPAPSAEPDLQRAPLDVQTARRQAVGQPEAVRERVLRGLRGSDEADFEASLKFAVFWLPAGDDAASVLRKIAESDPDSCHRLAAELRLQDWREGRSWPLDGDIPETYRPDSAYWLRGSHTPPTFPAMRRGLLKQLAVEPDIEIWGGLLDTILLNLGDKGDLPIWTDLAEHPQAAVRARVMAWAGARGAEIIPTLKAHLGDEDALVRCLAAIRYAELGGDRSLAVQVIRGVAELEGGLDLLNQLDEMAAAPFGKDLYDLLLPRALAGDESAGPLLVEAIAEMPEKLDDLIPLYDCLSPEARAGILRMLTDGAEPSPLGKALLERISQTSSMEGYWASDALYRFGQPEPLRERIRADLEGPPSSLEAGPEFMAMAYLNDHPEFWASVSPNLEASLGRYKDPGKRAEGLRTVLKLGEPEQVQRIFERDLHRSDRYLEGLPLNEELARQLAPKLSQEELAEVAQELARYTRDPELWARSDLAWNACLLLRWAGAGSLASSSLRRLGAEHPDQEVRAAANAALGAQRRSWF